MRASPAQEDCSEDNKRRGEEGWLEFTLRSVNAFGASEREGTSGKATYGERGEGFRGGAVDRRRGGSFNLRKAVTTFPHRECAKRGKGRARKAIRPNTQD